MVRTSLFFGSFPFHCLTVSWRDEQTSRWKNQSFLLIIRRCRENTPRLHLETTDIHHLRKFLTASAGILTSGTINPCHICSVGDVHLWKMCCRLNATLSLSVIFWRAVFNTWKCFFKKTIPIETIEKKSDQMLLK